MRKIYSHKEGVHLTPLIIIDNTILDSIIDLGMTRDGLRYCSFDVDNIELPEQDESFEFKVYDVSNDEDAAHLESVSNQFRYITDFKNNICDEVVGAGLYKVVQRALTDTAALQAEFDAAEEKINSKLVELGFRPE